MAAEEEAQVSADKAARQTFQDVSRQESYRKEKTFQEMIQNFINVQYFSRCFIYFSRISRLFKTSKTLKHKNLQTVQDFFKSHAAMHTFFACFS